jgi:hypothetical protein
LSGFFSPEAQPMAMSLGSEEGHHFCALSMYFCLSPTETGQEDTLNVQSERGGEVMPINPRLLPSHRSPDMVSDFDLFEFVNARMSLSEVPRALHQILADTCTSPL